MNRLPFGLTVALNLFQQIIDPMLVGMEYVITYWYGIWTKSEDETQLKSH